MLSAAFTGTVDFSTTICVVVVVEGIISLFSIIQCNTAIQLGYARNKLTGNGKAIVQQVAKFIERVVANGML